MIIAKLYGGWGNQLFQYAFGKHLSIKHNTELKFDLSFLLDRTPKQNFVYRDYDLDLMNIEKVIATENEVKQLRTYNEPHFTFDNIALTLPNNINIDGYWQSLKYFNDIEDIIRKDFIIKQDPISDNAKQIYDDILNTNSVCINVRRTDFITIATTNQFHGFCGVNYFDKGISYINERIENAKYFVFSDDVDWCKENLNHIENVTFIGKEHSGDRYGLYLKMMRNCKHFIIPNSTFGWWAAWLSDNTNKIIIAPIKWFNVQHMSANDLIPNEWIRL